MNRCPQCSYLVPPAWETCKKCGAPLLAAVAAAPVTANGTRPPDAGPAPSTAAPPAATPAWAPTTLRPEPDLLPSSGRPSAPRQPASPRRALPRVDSRRLVAGIALIAAGAGAWAFWPSGSDKPPAPAGIEVLAPGDEVGSVDATLRVEAEVTVHAVIVNASQLFAQYGDMTRVTPADLAQFDSSKEIVDGAVESTSPSMVSLRATPDAAVIAVAGPDFVCAFARVDTTMNVANITVRTPQCRADSAPPGEWWAPSGGGGGGAGGGAPIIDV